MTLKPAAPPKEDDRFRKIAEMLLVAQDRHRIHARGPPGRKQRGNERDVEQHDPAEPGARREPTSVDPSRVGWVPLTVIAADVRPSDCGMGPEMDAVGLNLAGVLPIGVYDLAVDESWSSQRLLPTARSAIVVGAGGTALSRSYRAVAGRGSLDNFVAQFVAGGCVRLRSLGWESRAFGYDALRGGQYVDLIALAERAGLGAASRLGLLLHRQYGPWLSLRALVLTERRLPAAPGADEFSPCEGCAAPCSDACPVEAPRALPAGFDLGACGAQRALQGPCRLHCDARRACVVGPEHAYDLDAEESHMAASLSDVLARAKTT
jgi:hypothetical protein